MSAITLHLVCCYVLCQTDIRAGIIFTVQKVIISIEKNRLLVAASSSPTAARTTLYVCEPIMWHAQNNKPLTSYIHYK